jgi:hypothetical protein
MFIPDPGSRRLDPDCFPSQIPDPDSESRGQKALDPRSGFTTLQQNINSPCHKVPIYIEQHSVPIPTTGETLSTLPTLCPVPTVTQHQQCAKSVTPCIFVMGSFLKIIEQVTPRINNTQSATLRINDEGNRRLPVSLIAGSR